MKLLICFTTESLIVSVSTPSDTSLEVVDFGDSVSIDCNASMELVDYEWFKVNQTSGDSVPVTTNQTLTVSFESSNDTEQAGYYFCKASMTTSLMGVANVSEVILVVFAPTFVEQPSSVSTSVDESVELQCRAVGFPQPMIRWVRLDSNNNTTNLPMDLNITANGNSSILTFNSVEADDFGSYHCMTTPPSTLPGDLSVISSLTVTVAGSGMLMGSGSGVSTTLTPVLAPDLTDSVLENLTASSNIAILTGESLVHILTALCNCNCLSRIQYLLLSY